MLLILTGRSGTGKDTVAQYLKNLKGQQNFERIVTYTTRPKRKNEVDGVDYHFISEKEFKQKEKEGFFLETTSFKNSDKKTLYYGTSFESLEAKRKSVLILNPSGVEEIRNYDYNVCVVHIDADDDIISHRLTMRGDNPKEIKRRMKADKKDFKNIDKFTDYRINNHGDLCSSEIAHILSDIYKKHLTIITSNKQLSDL